MNDVINFDQFLKNNSSDDILDEIPVYNNISNINNESVMSDIKIESNNGLYKIYRDKYESFTCELEIDGADIHNTNVRLMFETNDWNIFIDGEIDINGNVEIPIKKMTIFNEGVKGKIRMEVIADNTLFIPWEDDFEVKLSKKVTMKFNESKSVKHKDNNVNIKMK